MRGDSLALWIRSRDEAREKRSDEEEQKILREKGVLDFLSLFLYLPFRGG